MHQLTFQGYIYSLRRVHPDRLSSSVGRYGSWRQDSRRQIRPTPQPSSTYYRALMPLYVINHIKKPFSPFAYVGIRRSSLGCFAKSRRDTCEPLHSTHDPHRRTRSFSVPNSWQRSPSRQLRAPSLYHAGRTERVRGQNRAYLHRIRDGSTGPSIDASCRTRVY